MTVWILAALDEDELGSGTGAKAQASAKEPGPPATAMPKADIIDALGFGHENKVVVRFTERFWAKVRNGRPPPLRAAFCDHKLEPFAIHTDLRCVLAAALPSARAETARTGRPATSASAFSTSTRLGSPARL
jgi:hypothetical protein